MLNLFTPSAQDKSLEYLYRLFGDMQGLLGGKTTTIAIFGEMFRVFNSIALVIGTLIVVYTTIVGVLKTAAEGEFLGRQWNSLWIPLRMVLGIAALFPTPSGYSGLQILMMWCIMQGVGAADTVWRQALAVVNVVGSPYTESVNIPDMAIKPNIGNLFTMAVCVRSLAQAPSTYVYQYNRENYNYPGIQEEVYTRGFTPADAFNQPGQPYKPGELMTIGFGKCGSIALGRGGACLSGDTGGFDGKTSDEINDMLNCRVANSQLSAIKDIRTAFATIADTVLQIDSGYLAYLQLGVDLASIPPGTSAYKTQLAKMKDALNNNPGLQTACDTLVQNGTIKRLPGQSTADACIANAQDYTKLGYPPSVPDKLGKFQSLKELAVMQIYYPGLVKAQPAVGNSNFIQLAVDNYISAIAKPVLEYKRWQIAQAAQNPKGLAGAYQSAEINGWIYAGAYYYLLSQNNNQSFNAAANATFQANLAPQDNPPLDRYYNNMTTASLLVQAANGQLQAGTNPLAAGGIGASGAASSLRTAGDANNYVGSTFYQQLGQKKTDPLIALQDWGFALLWLVPILWSAVLIAFIALSTAVSIKPSVLGTGIGNPAEGPFWFSFLWVVVPIFFLLFTTLISVGALIGIYTPLIPYIIFITGALGWLISIVETMVAGPLVALGILAPGGHHDVLGKAEPALMLLFSNFLRPTLMIFGMFAAMLLAPIALDLLNVTFKIAMAGVATTGGKTTNAQSPISILFFGVVYVMLIVTLLNKCFAAIHIIPERVMAWIGGQGAQYGEGEALQEARRSAESGAHAVGSGMGEMKGQGAATGKQRARNIKDEKSQDDKGGNANVT